MINEIYKQHYCKGEFSYVGTLRNQKRFNIDDKVYFCFEDNTIAYGYVIGVEKTIDENPDFIYKLRFTKRTVGSFIPYSNSELRNEFESCKEEVLNIKLKCDRIFSTIAEAKESAIKNLNRGYELEMNNINRYFGGIKNRTENKSDAANDMKKV